MNNGRRSALIRRLFTWPLTLPLCVGGLLLTSPTPVEAHGGTYTGPGDTVPPGGGGGGGGGGGATPGTGNPAGPGGPNSGSPQPHGPGYRGPGQPGNSNAPGMPSSGGPDAGYDPTSWEYWWGFNQDPFLNLEAALFSGGPSSGLDGFYLGRGATEKPREHVGVSRGTISSVIVPALLAALENERDNDVVTGALVALAKIGESRSETGETAFGLRELFESYLDDSSQEIRETAALSLGILASDEALETLFGLALDTPAGRELLPAGTLEIDLRTRAFAVFGLGFAGQRAESELRSEIVSTLVGLLEGEVLSAAQADLGVAAISSLGLVALPSDGGLSPTEDSPATGARAASTSREAQVRWLVGYFEREDVDDFVRAHVPTAIARLLQTGDLRAPYTHVAEDSFAGSRQLAATALLAVLEPHAKTPHRLRQSAVLALGRLGDVGRESDGDRGTGRKSEREDLDARIRASLLRATEDVDQLTKRYALMALADVGARVGSDSSEDPEAVEELRGRLLKSLSRGKGGVEHWAALSLAVLERSRVAAGRPTHGASLRDLHTALERARSSADIAPFAVALGIAKDPDAAPLLRAKLERENDPATRGYLMLALGLAGDFRSAEAMQKTLAKARFQGELLRQAAIGLGLLGDRHAAGQLVEMLEQASSQASQAAIAGGLGFIGDEQSVQPLTELLGDRSKTGAARGFAAAALGLMADEAELSWNTSLRYGLAWGASTRTLTSSSSGDGICDLL